MKTKDFVSILTTLAIVRQSLLVISKMPVQMNGKIVCIISAESLEDMAGLLGNCSAQLRILIPDVTIAIDNHE